LKDELISWWVGWIIRWKCHPE